MTSLPHIPVLRFGEPYRSMDRRRIRALGTGDTVAEMSIGNAGLIRRDARSLRDRRRELARFSCAELVAMCERAGDLFLNATLPLGDGVQSPDDYVRQLSMTSGLPHTLVRANMRKVHEALTHTGDVLRGLTRGLPWSIIDAGLGASRTEMGEIGLSYYPTTEALGVVLPSNSPGVNALWLPAPALRTPVLIKPGSDEPWTPWRIIQAMIAAGIPASALGYYPTDHEGAMAVSDVCDRSIVFGGADTMRRHAGDPRVEVHGPGWSKVIIGEDLADRWEDAVDVVVESISSNSGRSCINASTVIVPRHARELAEAVAARLAAIVPLAPEDPDARLSAIANPAVARWADAQIELALASGGAEDVTRRHRADPARLAERDGMTYALPTLIRCDDPGHPLADREYMFPFAAVVEVPQAEMLARMSPALVVTAITRDERFVDDLIRSPKIQRLNLGYMPTGRAEWDQPHEGNLFELLYTRRAIQGVRFRGMPAAVGA